MLPVVLSSNSTAEIKHFAHAHTSLCTATNMLLGDTTSGFFFFFNGYCQILLKPALRGILKRS